MTIAVATNVTLRRPEGADTAGLEYGGGFTLEGPGDTVASANITPDASGIGYYDEAYFIQAMRTGYVKARKLNSDHAFWRIRRTSLMTI